MATLPSARAQTPCTFGSITPTIPLTYAPIARAAHVEGTVVLLVRFAHDGSVESERVLYGPKMLTYTAEPFVKGLRAVPSEGSRECPIAIRYEMRGVSNAECGSPAALANERVVSGLSTTDSQHFHMVSIVGCVVTMYSIAETD